MDSTNNWLGFNGAVVADLHPPPQRGMEEAEPQKLENFLRVQEPTTATASGRPFGPGGASTIGLSMIKNWLRCQPVPAGAADRNMALVPALPEGNGTVASASGVSGGAVMEAAQQKAKPPVETFGQRTSVYRGVTKHRWTGRYEAHLWDNSCRREGQTRKGRQVYLGGYDKEEKAGRAYDLAALKYWGTATTTNFPVSEYEKELEEMKHMTRQEYVASLRRKSSGFSRGASMYRGVTRHHQHGRWQARIGRVAGNKDLYLGTFSTQEEAAEAYDIAALKFRGLNAVTNFDMSRYDVKTIIESHIPIGASGTKRTKAVPGNCDMGFDYNGNDAGHLATSNLLTDGIGSYGPQHGAYGGCAPISFLPPALQCNNGHGYSRMWSKQKEQDGAVVAAAHSLHNLQHFPTVDSTHNFFQPSAVQEVMGFEEMHGQLLDSNSVVYNGGVGYHGAVGHSGYAMPFGKLVGHGQGNLAGSSSEDDGGTVSDLYNGQNFYLSQDSPLGDANKNNTYGQGQGVENENRPGSSAAVMSRKADDMMVCHGLPLYHHRNDT